MGKPFVKPVEKVELQHKHTFHFKEMYKMMHDWLEENDYVADTGKDSYEKFYAENVHDNGMKEVRYWWHMYKNPSPEKDLVKFHLTIRVRGLAIVDKEVAWGDRKIKVQDGEITIEIAQEIIINYNILDNHWLGEFVKKAVQKRWYKNYYEQYKDQAYADFYRFEDTVKRWLNWYQVSLVPRPHRDSLGGYKTKPDL